MKKRFLAVTLVLVILALMVSCEDGNNLDVGKSKKQSLSYMPDLAEVMEDTLLIFKNNYDKITSLAEDGPYSQADFWEKSGDLSDVYEEIGVFMKSVQPGKLTVGYTEFSADEKICFSVDDSPLVEDLAYFVDGSDRLYVLMPMVLLEMIDKPSISLNGVEYKAIDDEEEFPVAKITEISGDAFWTKGSNNKVSNTTPGLYGVTINEYIPKNFLSVCFDVDPEFFFIRKTYSLDGKNVKTVYSVSNPKTVEIDEYGREKNALALHFPKESDGLTIFEDYDFINYEVFMFDAEGNYYKRNIAFTLYTDLV